MREMEKTINALRMGVVPRDQLQSFMVGKEEELKELNHFLEVIASGGSQIRFLRGGYGTGKTLLLNALSETALSQNYIVANISMHTGFGFSKLEDIYHSIMSHLASRYDEGAGSSFEGIFNHWLKTLRSNGDLTSASKRIYQVISELKAYNSSFSNVLLLYIRAKINHDFELANAAAAWIKGDPNIAYGLKRQLNVKGAINRANAMDVLRGFVKLIHLMGYHGLIILFDEAELMMHQRSDIRDKAYGNLRQLMDLSGLGELAYSGFVFVGTPHFFDDQEKGIKSYQALYQRIGANVGHQGVNNYRQPIIDLKPLSREDYGQLCLKVVAIHQHHRNQPIEVPTDYMVNLVLLECRHLSQKEGLTVRIFVKKLIELLDLLEDNPELPLFKAMFQRSITE